MKQTFTILWIEDKPSVIKGQKKAIEKYLEEKDFDSNIIINETGENIEQTIKENEVAIVVTDKNLTEDTSGIDVVKLINSKKLMTDVLFYSSRGLDPNDIRDKIGHYSFIEIIDGKQVEEPLKKLIDKNIKRCNDIVFLRGMIISRAIDVELKLNDFFCEYFIRKPLYKRDHFNDFMLENRNTGLYGKIKSLSKILTQHNLKIKYPIITKLQKICEERNLLAHSKKLEGNVLKSMGKEEQFDRKRIMKLSKKIETVVDYLEKLNKEKFKSNNKAR